MWKLKTLSRTFFVFLIASTVFEYGPIFIFSMVAANPKHKVKLDAPQTRGHRRWKYQ